MTRLAALFACLQPDPRADAALLRAFVRDRDGAAFAELVRRHGPTVWGVCRRTLPNPADAEDAFQATFLVLLRRGPPAGCLAAWLYRVAVLTSRGLRRTDARRRTVSLTAGVDPAARPEPPPADVDALLMRLPERERAAVVLCHLHGLTQREAAERLGVAEGTLSARLSRGLRRLREASLAGLTVAVPAGVADAALTVATAGRAAGPGVSFLVTEVLRVMWLKKLATAGLAVVAVGVLGLGVAGHGSTAALATPPADAAAAKPRAADPALVQLRERFAAELANRVNKEEGKADRSRPVSREEHERSRVEQLAEHIKETADLTRPVGGVITSLVIRVQGEEWQPVSVRNFKSKPCMLCPYTIEASTADGTEAALLPTLPDLRAHLARLKVATDARVAIEFTCESEALRRAVRLICHRAGITRAYVDGTPDNLAKPSTP